MLIILPGVFINKRHYEDLSYNDKSNRQSLVTTNPTTTSTGINMVQPRVKISGQGYNNISTGPDITWWQRTEEFYAGRRVNKQRVGDIDGGGGIATVDRLGWTLNRDSATTIE